MMIFKEYEPRERWVQATDRTALEEVTKKKEFL